MEQSVDLHSFYNIFKKHWKTILNSTIIGVMIALIITFVFMTPKYQSQTQIVASLPKQSANTNNNDVNNNLQLMNTYKEFVTGDVVMEQASKKLSKLDIKRSSKQLKNEVSVAQPQNSLMFTITITDPDKYDAKTIANVVSQSFTSSVKKYLNASKISIISYAQVASRPSSPRKGLNILLGIVLGFLVGIGLAFIFDKNDLTVKDEDFIKNDLKLPVIGHVSEISQNQLNATTKKRTFSINSKSNNNDQEKYSRVHRNI